MEATIDPANRLIHAIAEIEDPFRQKTDPGKLPLQRGLFVEAEIQGRTVQDVYSLPDMPYAAPSPFTLLLRRILLSGEPLKSSKAMPIT